MASNIAFEALGAMFSSLTPARRKLVEEITSAVTRLKLPRETSDAIISVVILEASERQFVEDGGSVPPPRDSTLDLLRPLFESKKTKTNPVGSN